MASFLHLLALAGLLAMLGPVRSLAAQQPASRPGDELLSRPDLQAVVELQVERDAERLIDLLASPDAAVRARAAFALGSVQDSAAVPALLALLDDALSAVRADAAFALGQMSGGVDGARLLTMLEQETDPDVRERLIEAIGKQGKADALVALVAMSLPERLEAARALAVGRFAVRDVHAPEAIAYLLRQLGSDNPLVQQNAAYYFGRSTEPERWADQAMTLRYHLGSAFESDTPATPHLLLALGRLEDMNDVERFAAWLGLAPTWRTRVSAARALQGLVSSVLAQEALVGALGDSSDHVAQTAASALATADRLPPEVVAALRAYVEVHPDRWRVTAALLPALAKAGEAAFVLGEAERVAALGAPARYARVLPSLSSISQAEAFDELQVRARDEDARVAYAALSALASRWQRGDRLLDELRPLYFDAFAAGVQRRDLATTYAAAPLLSDSLFWPLGAVPVLVSTYQQMRTPEDIEPMTAILGALGRTRDASAERLVRQALEHPHPVVRSTAAQALLEMTGEVAEAPAGSEPPERTVDWAYLAERGRHPRLILETEKGLVTLTLDAEQAPLTVQTILQFAEAGRYDGVPFHRVVPNFVIQGGDFARRDGFGGPPFSIRSEFTRIPYARGTAGIASAGKDTEGSQYFVTLSMQPHLDGRYTAFGTVTRGMDVVDRIYEDDKVVRAHVEVNE